MPNYNFLKHNQSDFPHISNVDTYRYDNDFDYGRFDYDQMSLLVCTVPWDMGEAHIGNRTISGIGNVVYFETKEKRDAWFDAIPDSDCYRFTTKFKELHRDGFIDVPIPYDMCAKHNYLVVHYEKFANENSPVMYEGDDGLRDWFWFIREVEFLAPNTTRLHIMDDAFQTWIYDVDISGMILERGHAPMFATSVDDYLSDPLANNANLLTEDVNYGDATNVKHIDAFAFNSGDVYACIASTANLKGNWGSKANNDWKTPASSYYTNDGIPSVYVFAVLPENLNSFLANVDSQVPQFKQTIQAVFFVPREMVTVAGEFTFADTTCYNLRATRHTFDFVELEKSLFGYERRYREIAKLYTSPYAHIEITDENGDVEIIKVEDTSGELRINALLTLAYPFISIDAHLLGVGSASNVTVTYRNITQRSITIGGKWYETLRSWDIPTFAVMQDASVNNDYATHFDRAQQVVDYTTAYDNETASATTAQSNANASAATAQSNANASAATAQSNANDSATASRGNENASADTLVSNTALQTTANSAITSRSNQASNQDANLSNALSQALQAWESGYARDTVNDQIDAAYASAAIGAAGGAANSAISGAMSGAAAGPAGAAIGAVGGLITGAISGATSMAQTAVAANLTSEQAENTIQLSQSKVDETSQNNSDRTTNQNSANTANTTTSNTASTGMSANSAATQKANATRSYNAVTGNATRSYNTETANATRSYNTETANATRDYNTAVANAGRTRSQAQSAIQNELKQAALAEPLQFGAFANGDTAVSKPMALFAHVVTQSKSAISSAGDEFLRYGYMLDRQWPFNGNWNVGKYFTYWKLKDFWVKNLNVPDMYMDRLRFFLFGGVTIWRKPEDIGNVTVYENFN